MNVNVYVYAMHVCVFYVHVYWDFKYMYVHFSILPLSVCPSVCPSVSLSGCLSVGTSVRLSVSIFFSHLQKVSKSFLILRRALSERRVLPVQVYPVKVVEAEEYNGLFGKLLHVFSRPEHVGPRLAVHRPPSHRKNHVQVLVMVS